MITKSGMSNSAHSNNLWEGDDIEFVVVVAAALCLSQLSLQH